MSNTIEWSTKSFGDLVCDELYDILNLRAKVFVVEQDAVYLDLDYKDQKALHVQGRIDGRLVAYCRLFGRGDYFEEACIGRVVVDGNDRRMGYGHELMLYAIDEMRERLNETEITISAQLYLKRFYESHNFRQVSETYLEDGIPHIRMRRE